MKMLCVIIITSFITSCLWEYFHTCPVFKNTDILKLKQDLRQRDSILYLWLNDYTWHIRVIAGVEKDSSILRYQKWNKKKKPEIKLIQ